jgi:hypothetical protein
MESDAEMTAEATGECAFVGSTTDPKADSRGIVAASCPVEVGKAVCRIADPETPGVGLSLRRLFMRCGGDTVAMHGAGLA